MEQLWLALLVGVLRQKKHLSSIWRILFEQPTGFFLPVKLTYEAIRKRLLKAGSAPLQALFLTISAGLATWADRQQINALPLALFASGIYALDECTMEQIRRLTEHLRSVADNDPHLIPGKIAGLFDLRKQCWTHMQFRADVLAGCSVEILLLLQGLPPGSLILADLGYFSFPWFDYLTGQGYFWISRLKHRVTYSVQEVIAYDDHLGLFDAIVWLGNYRADQAAHAVRLIIYCHKGRQYAYLTNVLDPTLLSMQEVAQLYARRWDIELAFKVLKREVGLCLWWGACPQLLMMQVWIALILAQVLHALQLQVALQAEVEPFDVSMHVLIEILPMQPGPLFCWVQQMVQDGRRLGLIRPHQRIIPIIAQVPPVRPAGGLPITPQMQHLIRHPRYAGRNPHPRKEVYESVFRTQWLF
jgi:hypothetical protein